MTHINKMSSKIFQNDNKILDELKITAHIEPNSYHGASTFRATCRPKDIAEELRQRIDSLDGNIKSKLIKDIISNDVVVMYFKITYKTKPMEVTPEFVDALYTDFYNDPICGGLAKLTYLTQRQQMEHLSSIKVLRNFVPKRVLEEAIEEKLINPETESPRGKFMGPAERLMRRHFESYRPRLLEEPYDYSLAESKT